ncbi:MAG: hypothetical protein AAFQ41_09890, partial [Cyanobacteria bacterium J06623_7]
MGLNFNLGKADAGENILVIHSYNEELPATQELQLAIDQGFMELGSENNIYHEFLNGGYDLEAQQEQKFIEYISRKYRRSSIDLLMVVEEPSLGLILRQHRRFFAELPVVFVGIETVNQEILDTPWLTGIIEDHSLIETALEATRQNWSNTVVVIDNQQEDEEKSLNQIRSIESNSEQFLQIDTVNNLTPETVEERLSKYPQTVPIVMLGQLYQTQSHKELIDPSLDAQILSNLVPNPIYTDNSARLGNGVVGGKIFDTNYQ